MTIPKVSTILIHAKSLIDTPEKWTQNYYAKDAAGFSVPALYEGATCFCSIGAVYRATHDLDSESITNEALNLFRQVTGKMNIFMFNDCHTHSEVMTAWDAAIALAIKEEQKQEQP